MRDANHLRDLARHCRALSKTVIEPEVNEQLRVWAVDSPMRPTRWSATWKKMTLPRESFGMAVIEIPAPEALGDFSGTF